MLFSITPSNCDVIYGNAFSGCENLEEIVFKSSTMNWEMNVYAPEKDIEILRGEANGSGFHFRFENCKKLELLKLIDRIL